MSASGKVGCCTYCGRRRKLTRDHIPPKSLFPRPRPNNLITVPSCRECNEEASKDDEYFRLTVVLRNEVGQHAEARRVWQSVFRSLQRPQAIGLKLSTLKSIHLVMLRTRSGLYLGERPGYDVDLERLNRVADRIIKGLFLHERGHRLPDTHQSFAMIDPMIKHEQQGMGSMKKVFLSLKDQPVHDFGDGVFSYRCLFADDDCDSSVWLMIFYGSLFSVGMTLKQSTAETR